MTLVDSSIPNNGNWSQMLSYPLVDGVHQIVAQATDLLGNTAYSLSLPVQIDTYVSVNTQPDMTAATDHGPFDDDNITNDNTPTFEGTTEPAAFVELVLNGTTVLGHTTAGVDGKWTITPDVAIPNGAQSIVARVTDIAGNTDVSAPLPIVINTLVPAAPSAPDLLVTSDTGILDTDNLTNDTTPTFQGTGGAPHALVELRENYLTIGSGFADADGNWTATVAQALSEGPHSIGAGDKSRRILWSGV